MNQAIFTSTSTNMWALVWSPARQGDVRTILYLHGAGAFGTGMAGLFEYPNLPSLLRDGMEVDCRVVIPSCHLGEEWQPSFISSFLDDLERAYRKHKSGYDLLGYSRGDTARISLRLLSRSASELLRRFYPRHVRGSSTHLCASYFHMPRSERSKDLGRESTAHV